jgi:adenine-specific DNA-methyltransferase
MMYPRLFLARNLLKDDGVIFVSIDDNEVHNLRMIMNEIFGEENFIGDLVVKRAEGGGLAKQIIRGHDYLLAYSKNIDNFTPLKRPKDIRGDIVEKDGEEYWLETDWLRKEFGQYGTCMYEEIEEYFNEDKKKEIDQGLKEDKYRLIEQDDGQHVVARLRSVRDDGSKFYSILKHLSAKGVHDLQDLDLDSYFDFPKPVSLLRQLVLGATFHSRQNKDIILDFFTGSGTTAHAVMAQNAEDGGSRRCISVQLPEETPKDSEARNAGYENIAQIARERIRRVEHDLRGNSEFKDEENDTGFKAYKLDKSNFKHWQAEAVADEAVLQQKLEDAIETKGADAEELAMIYEIMLKLGIELTVEVEEVDGFYRVADTTICLAEDIDEEVVESIISQAPSVAVFLESGFASDEQKANTALQLKDADIEFKVV